MIIYGNPNESVGTSSKNLGRRNGRNFKHLERGTGFEPATSSLGRKHSTTELSSQQSEEE